MNSDPRSKVTERRAVRVRGHSASAICAMIGLVHRVAADPLDQRGDVCLAVLLAEHHQIALPVAELGALSDALRTVGQAPSVEDMGPLMSFVIARSAATTMFGQMTIERFLAAIPRIGEVWTHAEVPCLIYPSTPAGSGFPSIRFRRFPLAYDSQDICVAWN